MDVAVAEEAVRILVEETVSLKKVLQNVLLVDATPLGITCRAWICYA